MIAIRHCLDQSFERRISLQEAMTFPLFEAYGNDSDEYYLPYSFNVEYFDACLDYLKGKCINSNDLQFLSELLKCVDCLCGDIKPLGNQIISLLKKQRPEYRRPNPAECFKLFEMYKTKTIDYDFLETFQNSGKGFLVPYLPLHLRVKILFECHCF
jgi:hypothetical protein